MISPWKWKSVIWNDRYFEKQKDSEIWIDVLKNQVRFNYTEVSVDIDSNGYPIVVLKTLGKAYFVKLTESLRYGSKELANISTQYEPGVWEKQVKGN